MRIAIACDHGGYGLKETLVPFIASLGHEIDDMGCFSEASVDYPDYAFPLCEAVADGMYDRGILICGTGIGMSICANKVDKIRCALCLGGRHEKRLQRIAKYEQRPIQPV